MKTVLIGFLLCVAQSSFAGNAYRMYLLTKSQQLYKQPQVCITQIPNARFIPAYEIPKGSVFCRMEDKLTRLTGVWFKIGVK